VNGTAPASVDVSWAAPSDTGGGTIRYEVKLDSGGWVDSGTDRSHRFTGVGAGGHSVQVRAFNVGSQRAGPADTANFNVANPQPSGSLGKGPSRACDSGGGGCAEVRITWSNMDPGTYRVFATINGSSCCGYQQTVDVGANGQLQLMNHLGVRSAGETIAVRFENVSGGTSRTLGAISGTQWNNLGYNTW
jgi:hypothetical protein